MQDTTGNIKVYGAEWCGYTKKTRQHLDQKGVSYQYIDVEFDPKASEWVKEQNNGIELKPTLEINGEVLKAPKNDELDQALQKFGITSQS